jgi:phosphoenolpyruvate synthase/pyruvate phosphate dikinase
MTFGISRDDAEGKFLLKYVEDKILPENPFQSLDRDGVGSCEDGRPNSVASTRPDIEIGICGEHGGDPSSIEFCHQVGLNYVSCSPYPRAGGPPRRGPGKGCFAGRSDGRRIVSHRGWCVPWAL